MKRPHMPRRRPARALVRPIALDRDAARLPALFRSFDSKAYQQRVQGIDPDRLAAFLAERVAGAAKTQLTWTAERRGKLVGLAALQTSHWHSTHCGFPMGKVTQLMTAPGEHDALAPMLAIAEGAARRAKLHHLAGRIDAHDFHAQEILTQHRWYPVGTSVKFAVRLDPASAADAAEGLTVRPHRSSDRARLLEIAAQSHEENHLHFDPHLPSKGTHAIFAQWVEMCLDGQAAQVWVAELGGETVGFVTILVPRALNVALGTKIAVLDFIVLAAEVKGRGLGSALLAAVHAKVAQSGFDQIELRTTATNFAAVNLYTRHGYRLTGCDQVFGRWLRREGLRTRAAASA